MTPHTSAYVSIRQHTEGSEVQALAEALCQEVVAQMRQHTSAYVSILTYAVQALAEALCQEVVAQMRDVPGGGRDGRIQVLRLGTAFTCFTGTKVPRRAWGR